MHLVIWPLPYALLNIYIYSTSPIQITCTDEVSFLSFSFFVYGPLYRMVFIVQFLNAVTRMLLSKQVVTHHFANIGNLSIQSNLFNKIYATLNII